MDLNSIRARRAALKEDMAHEQAMGNHHLQQRDLVYTQFTSGALDTIPDDKLAAKAAKMHEHHESYKLHVASFVEIQNQRRLLADQIVNLLLGKIGIDPLPIGWVYEAHEEKQA